MSKLALITGGGSGIGQALTYKLVEAGWHVYIVGRNENKLKQTAVKYPDSISWIQADLEDLDSYERIKHAYSAPTLDLLVHNAAVIDPIQSIRNLSLVGFEALMRINVTAALGLTQQLLPKLNGKRVVFISSGAASFSINEWTAYCTSKAALHMIKLCFQNECKDVAFADVMPGIVSTPMLDHVQTQGFDGVDFFSRLASEGRLLKPEVVSDFIIWLSTMTTTERFSAETWDIYDLSHHNEWLKDGKVPSID